MRHFITILLLFTCNSYSQFTIYEDGILANVNGKIITNYELEVRLNDFKFLNRFNPNIRFMNQLELKKKLIQDMVDDILIYDEFLLRGGILPKSLIEQSVNKHIQFHGSKQEFIQSLDRRGYSLESYTSEVITKEVAVERMFIELVERKIRVNPKEIISSYNENLNDYKVDTKVKYSVYGVTIRDASQEKDYKTLVQIRTELKQSNAQTAADLADFHDTSNRYIPLLDINEVIREKIPGLQKGDVSEFFKLDNAYVIIKIDDIKPGKVKPFEEVKNIVENKLFRAKREILERKFIENIRKKASFKINYERLKLFHNSSR